MTETNDEALPNPGDQQTPDPATVAAAAAAAANGEQAPDPGADDADDFDLKSLKDAQAAADAEDAAGGATDQGTTVEPGQTGQQQQTQPTDQNQAAPTGDAVTIPKGRFDEVSGQRDKAKEEAAYWRGVAEARNQQPGTQTGQPGQQQPTQQPTADQRLAAIQAQQDALAKKFDDGEITYSDLVKAQRDLTNKEQGIREEVLLAKVKPTAAAVEPGADPYSQSVTAQIEHTHPWVGVFEKLATKTQWASLRNEAFDNLVEKGIDPTTSTGVLQLREEVAALMDQRGPLMLADKAKAKGIVLPGQTQQQPQGAQAPGPKKSALALAREAKLEQSANAPPNLAAMSGTAQTGGMTEAQIEALSGNDDAYDALPEATRRTLLGIQ